MSFTVFSDILVNNIGTINPILKHQRRQNDNWGGNTSNLTQKGNEKMHGKLLQTLHETNVKQSVTIFSRQVSKTVLTLRQKFLIRLLDTCIKSADSYERLSNTALTNLDWHHARNNRYIDTNLTTICNKLEEGFSFEEKLSNNKISTSINFFLQMNKIFIIATTVRMTLWIT